MRRCGKQTIECMLLLLCTVMVLTKGFSVMPVETSNTNRINENRNSNIWISPPSSDDDYKGLSTLLVKTFESPQQKKNENSSNNIFVWETIIRPWLEWSTYRRYVQTARKLKKVKYAILIAKKMTQGKKNNRVVGMVEIGMTKRSNGKVVPTLGVLCVDPEFQRNGIGTSLVDRAEQLVQNLWNVTSTTSIHVEVETNNQPSLEFFHSRGYQLQQQAVVENNNDDDDTNMQQNEITAESIRYPTDNKSLGNVTVLENGLLREERPCWILTKLISDLPPKELESTPKNDS